jgi:hypothetical protein
MPERQSVAQMRASGKVQQPTLTRTICLSSDLDERYRAQREELTAAIGALEQAKAKPGRAGGNPHVLKARQVVDEKSAALDATADEMAAFGEVDVVVRRHPAGDWNRWAELHPPREKEPDEQGRRALAIRDAQHGGRCDFDALVADLGEWVVELNGQPATTDEWEWLASVAPPASLDDLADDVLRLHGERVSLPKPLTPLLSTLLADSDSPSPESGESPPSGSTAGSPSTSPTTSTTTPDD